VSDWKLQFCPVDLATWFTSDIYKINETNSTSLSPYKIAPRYVVEKRELTVNGWTENVSDTDFAHADYESAFEVRMISSTT
jgi:hypothetical protein